MINYPDELRYSREHTWVSVDENLATVGITDYAQEELGEIFYVGLPDADTFVQQDEPFGTIESSKTVAELIAPVSGEIVSVNEELADDVGIVNSDPYNTGWMIVIALNDPGELDALLDAEEYSDYVDEDDGGVKW